MQRFFNNRCHRTPYRFRIMLHPTRLRVNLRKLLLSARYRGNLVIVYDAATAAGALINCQQEFAHQSFLIAE